LVILGAADVGEPVGGVVGEAGGVGVDDQLVIAGQPGACQRSDPSDVLFEGLRNCLFFDSRCGVGDDWLAEVEHQLESVVHGSHLVDCQMPHPCAEHACVEGPTISHITRVGSSATTTSGWKLAGGVEVEVGQTRTVESASRSSACTSTAKRRPC
jgi:hypothetical protein